jgi:hypothetical protein
MYTAWACARPMVEKAGPISSSVRTPTKLSSSDTEAAIAFRSWTIFVCGGVSGFHRTATRVRRGIASLNS